MDMQNKYGVDVAVTRADDLDKKMLTDVRNQLIKLPRTFDVLGSNGERREVVSVLDIGCGGGGQSARLAVVGASVIGVDICDHTDVFRALRGEQGLSEDVLQFVQGDMIQLDSVLGEQRFDAICFQRTLHYVPYSVAMNILCELHTRLKKGRMLYIAVTGLESDIGLHYEDTQKTIEDRFCRLTTEGVETFSITEPLCLYTPEEFIVLLLESGWNIEEFWVSAFGNIKAVCT